VLLNAQYNERLSSSLILNIFPVNVLLKRFGYTEISGAPCGWRSTFGCARRRYWIYAPSAWIGTWLWPGQSVILRQVPLGIRENDYPREICRALRINRFVRPARRTYAKRNNTVWSEIFRVIALAITRDTRSSWKKVFFIDEI